MTTSLRNIIGITFVVQLLTFAMTVANNVLAARWLGPAAFGVMVTILLLPEIINKCTNMGLETSILYYIGNRRFPEKRFLSTTIINGIVLYLLGVLAIIAFILADGHQLLFSTAEFALAGDGLWWSIYLLFAAILHEYGGNIWLGRQQFNRYNGNILFRPLIYFLLLLGFYLTNTLTVAAALFTFATSWLLPGIYIWWKSIFPLKLSWDKTISFATFRYGSQIMVTNLLVFLIYRADLLLIGYFLSQTEVAYYYVAVIIAERLHYLTKSVRIVMLPAASYSKANQEKMPLIARLNLLIVAVGAGLLALLAHWLIPLVFSTQYNPAVKPLLYLLPGIIAITLPKLLSADFAARGLPKYDLYASAVNFIVNLGLNLWLIPRYGISGAAISSSISYIIAASLTAYFYRRITGLPFREFLLPQRNDWQALRKL